MITVDRDLSSAVFSRSDGKEARFPLVGSPFEDTSALLRLHFTPTYGGLLAVTRADDKILFELPKKDSGDQLAGRLAVYLDQNMWSTISNTQHYAAKATSDARAAARQLAEWVQQRRIVLPASAGHFYETGKWSDSGRRYHLGLTVLQLSRGWQLRDPLEVRRNELYDAFCRHSGRTDGIRTASVFTLEPNAVYSDSRSTPSYTSAPEFHPDVAFQLEALTVAVASIDAMLDSERCVPGPDTGWTAANQAFSDWLDQQERDSQQKRNAIDIFLLSDLQQEIAEEACYAGMPSEQFRGWILKQAMRDIEESPALGLFRAMLHERHLNKGTIWRPNDLTDMIYLSCAAGYADFVVCERHMRATLAQALKRQGRTTPVFRRLSDAVRAIKETLASGQT